MFFILSKTLNYLVMPTTVICICFLLAAFLRNQKWRRRFFWIALGLLLLMSNDFISNELMKAWEIEPRTIDSLPKYELAIVLTGATIPHEPTDRVYFQRGADRVTHTVQLYKLGYLKKVLISGGSARLTGDAIPEADLFRKAMVMMGVPAEDIIIENETRNTAESALQVRAMIDSLGFSEKDCVLITSAFHMRRSVACFRKQGVHLDTFSTDFYSHERNFYIDTLFVPKVDAIVVWHKLVREWVGFVAYKLAGYV